MEKPRFAIHSLDSSRPQLDSVATFVKNLRRYRRDQIIHEGRMLLWDIFKSKEQHTAQQIQVLYGYAHKVMLLGMATCNNHRNTTLDTKMFYDFCEDYLSIKETVSDPVFLDSEAKDITAALVSSNFIPIEFCKYEHIRPSCSELFISRMLRQQHEVFHAGIEDLYTSYSIFKILDHNLDGLMTKRCKEIFKISPLHFFRSGFGLFSMANDNRHGYINLQGLNAEQKLQDVLGIDIDTTRLVASKISYNESLLRGEWYKSGLLAEDIMYQKYYPTPLSEKPVIHMDLSNKQSDWWYLIPSPALFIKVFPEIIFSQIIRYDNENGSVDGINQHRGDAVEEYILCALELIFGKENVSKIPEGNKKKADFHIRTKECDLVIELKSSLGRDVSVSIMSPKQVANIWERLYDACVQCASSVEDFSTSDRKIIPIILVANHVTAEMMPFQTFLKRSGALESLKIDHIEILSWHEIEEALSETSVENFIGTLLDRYSSPNFTPAGLITYEIDEGTPAHNYEYLESAESEIFPHRI